MGACGEPDGNPGTAVLANPPAVAAAREDVPVVDCDWDLLAFRCGREVAALDLGGVPIRVAGEEDRLVAALAATWADFLAPVPPAAIDFHLRAVDSLPMAAPAVYPAAAARGSSILVKLRGMALCMDRQRRLASALVEHRRPVQDLSNLLRMLLVGFAPDFGRFLFHGAAMELCGGGGAVGILFGPPHAGKSTAAKLAAPRRVLSDDAVLLGLDGGRLLAATAGLWGEEGSEGLDKTRRRAERRVALLATLVQAAENRVVALGGARGAMAVSCSILLPPADGELRRQSLEFAARAAGAAPVVELAFSDRDGSFFERLEASLGIGR